MTDNEKSLLQTKFTITNFFEDYALDCNGEAGALGVADVLATLIRDLSAKGIINNNAAVS
ncbi:hypothetical protein LCGC14_2091650 [marine sediment metagenome]|uniref:Uncharacterized protein n=1 Tax=marine sediment metagenome TaxID=412755 RepID=A0A0F9GQQ4_9ZZZZ